MLFCFSRQPVCQHCREESKTDSKRQLCKSFQKESVKILAKGPRVSVYAFEIRCLLSVKRPHRLSGGERAGTRARALGPEDATGAPELHWRPAPPPPPTPGWRRGGAPALPALL